MQGKGFEIAKRPLTTKALVPADIAVPEMKVTSDWVVRLLTLDDIAVDWEAFMTNVAEVQRAFDPGQVPWPTHDFTVRQWVVDTAYCVVDHYLRVSFVYAVLNRNQTKELGCIYIYPCPNPAFDAEVVFWVRESELSTGLESELEVCFRQWMEESWPFQRVAFPGLDMPWRDWASLPEA